MTFTDPSPVLTGRVFSAVIFDMDQTLVDSLPSISRCWTAWAEHYGVDADPLHGYFGIPADKIIEDVLPQELRSDALARIEALESEDVTDIVPMPGAMDALHVLPSHRTAIATSAVDKIFRSRLRASKLPTPGVVVTRDLVARGKPAPDIFLLAAQRLGADVSDCLVVEDAPAGIEAARAAGMASLGLLTTCRQEELEADLVVPTLAHVAWMVEAEGVSLRLR